MDMQILVGLGVAIFGIGLATVGRLLKMRASTKQALGGFGIALMLVGIVVAGYGFVARPETQNAKGSPSIAQTNPHNSPPIVGNQNQVTTNPQTNQTMKDSPWGVQIQGDNNIVNQGPQPRKLTPAQEERFVQVLKENPKGHVTVTCPESGGPEPCNFARQLVRLLESPDAGWTVNFTPMIWGAGDPTKTIPPLYLEAQSAMPPPFAFALREALKAADHEPVCLTKADQPPDFLQLTVWQKGEQNSL